MENLSSYLESFYIYYPYIGACLIISFFVGLLLKDAALKILNVLFLPIFAAILFYGISGLIHNYYSHFIEAMFWITIGVVTFYIQGFVGSLVGTILGSIVRKIVKRKDV